MILNRDEPSALLFEPNVFVVLSGGGNKGCLQGGHIKAIRGWLRAHPSCVLRAIAGTSIGSFNGSMWAAGKSDLSVQEFWETASIKKFGTLNMKLLWAWAFGNKAHKGYILDNGVLRKNLQGILPSSWNDLLYPLFVAASAYVRSGDGKELFYSNAQGVRPVDAVLASMAVPGIFRQPFFMGTHWGDAGCMLNNIPLLDVHASPYNITFASLLGYAGLAPAEEQAKYWPWNWLNESREKVAMAEYQREIYSWGRQISEHVFFSPMRGWLVVIHNLEGRKLAAFDFSQGGELYKAGWFWAIQILTEFENEYRRTKGRP